MKLMVSLVLLAAVCHAAESSRSRREEEDSSAAKRQLQEGNFGLKIQPSVNAAFPNPPGGYDANKNELREGPPQSEYGPPQQPAKISDVLSSAQGPSVSAVIHNHLFSPVQVYQPNLGSPTTFEVSPPVRSQLAYSEHKIYQAAPTIQTFTNNQALNQNNQQLDQAQQVQSNPFGQIQPPLQPILPNQFLPRMEYARPSNPIQTQQLYKQVFAQQTGVIPDDIYQQINQLGSQMNFEGSIQIDQASEEQENKESENIEQQQQQNIGVQYTNQNENSEQQSQKVENQSRESQQLSTTGQPQAVSYASFSQGLPASSQSQYQSQRDQSATSPLPPRPRQELPQPQSPPLLQPAQNSGLQSVFFSIGTTPIPQTTIYKTVNQKPHRIGIINIRQKTESTTPQTFSVSTVEPQGSSTSTSTILSSDVNSQSTFAQEQAQTTRLATQTTRLYTPTQRFTRPTFRPFTRQSQATRATQNIFSSRPTLSPLFRRRTTLQAFSPSSSTVPPQPIILQTLSTLPPEPVSETLSSLPPSSLQQTLSSLPLQETLSTLSPSTPQPPPIQSTLTPVPLFKPQQAQPESPQPQFPTTLQPLQTLSTLHPVPVTQPQVLSSSFQSNLPGVTQIPTRPQLIQIQSESHPGTLIQENFEEKLQQQFSQQLPQQPQIQPQFPQISQQIQEQLQLIQQQIQLLQQQTFNQQPPQPVQIIQQQSSPTPQPIQLIQQQQPIPQQPIQLIQQQPQPSPVPPPVQLIQPQPSFLQQPQLVSTPLPPVQPPQLIQAQPTPIPPKTLTIQPQPQLVPPQPTLIQPQTPLIQAQPPQLIQTPSQQILIPPQPVQLLPRPQLSPQPQIEVQQNIQEQNQNNAQKADKSQKLENADSQKSKEEVDFYNHYLQTNFLNNNLLPEELYASFHPHTFATIHPHPYAPIPAQSLFPVPVGINSYPAASSLHSPLHTHLHSSLLHSPSLGGHSYHSTYSIPSVQYYGKHAHSILGGGWRKK